MTTAGKPSLPSCRALYAILCIAALGLVACDADPLTLGRQIYRQGIGADAPLSYRLGPTWLRSAGGGCAVCHGTEREGRTVQVGKVSGSAPALTAAVLAARGYDADALRRAIGEGWSVDGRSLDRYMPRWQLDTRDMQALITYLQSP